MMLEVEGLDSGYGQLQVLRGVALRVERGEWVALIGSTGAGKTTLMRTLTGLIAPTAGTIGFRGVDFTDLPAHRRVYSGLALVPEGRRLFAGMTVAENLMMGAYHLERRGEVAASLDRTFELFPVLRARRTQVVGTLSGGEQQMCAIGRALMSQPELLLIDELSLGLAPVVVDQLLAALTVIKRDGTTLLVVEQDVQTALGYADRGYVLRQGEIALSGPARQLLDDPNLQREFFGI